MDEQTDVLCTEQQQQQPEHKRLVAIAYTWVLNNAGCGIAFREMCSNSSNEIPDVIGFGSFGHSVLVEVKTSRADFLADKKKSFRKVPEQGMGSHRYYCCPTGMIRKEELPENWGLIYVDALGKARARFHPYGVNPRRVIDGMQKNMIAEHGLLYAMLRRLHMRDMLEQIYIPEQKK